MPAGWSYPTSSGPRTSRNFVGKRAGSTMNSRRPSSRPATPSGPQGQTADHPSPGIIRYWRTKSGAGSRTTRVRLTKLSANGGKPLGVSSLCPQPCHSGTSAEGEESRCHGNDRCAEATRPFAKCGNGRPGLPGERKKPPTPFTKEGFLANPKYNSP